MAPYYFGLKTFLLIEKKNCAIMMSNGYDYDSVVNGAHKGLIAV